MKKKSLFLLLTMVLMLMLSAVTVMAADTGSGTCGSGLTWKLDADGTLTISGNGAMNNYSSTTSGRAPWNKGIYWGDVVKVVVNEGVTSIGDYAFYDCTNMTDITMPSTLKTVGQRAFYNTKVAKVVFPEGVTSIGKYCFTETKGIQEVVLPDSLTTMGENCFYKCTNLEKVTFGDNLTAIPDYAFYDCGKLYDIGELPAALTSIGKYAFAYTVIDNFILDIPDAVATIGERAFCYTDIVMVKLPSGLTTLGENAFYKCEYLWRVEAHAGLKLSRSAFDYCDELTDVHFYGTEAQWNTLVNSAASYNTDFTNANVVYIPAGQKCSHLNWGVLEAVDPTCTKTGLTTGQKCWLCEEVFVKQEKVPALGHELTSWLVNEPTAGKQMRYCTRQACDFEEVKALGNPFKDVKKGDYFYDPVLWAFNNGVTTGMTANTFEPGTTCNRAQVVTFIWRAAGSPKPASSSNPFKDVERGVWYTDAVLWAAENGITTGTSETTFSPFNTITRMQFVTFLYRYAKNVGGDSTTDNVKSVVPFGDISSKEYYFTPVVWATQFGYCSGMGEGNFVPAGECTRGQVVTFLHRYFGQSPLYNPTAIAFNRTYYKIGDMNYSTPKLTATIFPEGSDAKVTWKSADPSIVKVSSDGTLTPISKGTTKVWAESNGIKNYCTVEIPDPDMGWYIYSTWRDIEGATYSKLDPWAGTYVDANGDMNAVVIFFHRYQSVGAGVQERFYTVAYNLDTGKAIKQPADYYENQADRYWGANRTHYMNMAIGYLNLEVACGQGNGFPQYYEKYDDLWVKAD